MIWLLVVIVVVVLALAIVLAVGCHDAPPDAATYRTALDLRAIRRRQEVAQFKVEVRRDGARARRELRHELSELHRRERGL
jgi:hypothetical protein